MLIALALVLVVVAALLLFLLRKYQGPLYRAIQQILVTPEEDFRVRERRIEE